MLYNLIDVTKHRQAGFTLIELLVVISIIGLLTATTLAALNSARSKAANASVKSNLANARADAAIYFDTIGSYVGVCAISGQNVIGDNVQAALDAGADTGSLANQCLGESSGWVAFSKLRINEGINTHHCVDSTGISSSISINQTTVHLTDGLDAGERCFEAP